MNIYDQLLKQINKSDSILIVSNLDYDSSSLAASLALFLFLQKLGKTVDIVSNYNLNDNYSFLPGFTNIKSELEHLRQFIVSLNIKNTRVGQIKYILENNELNFIITPKDGWFENKDVSSRAGKFRFDLIIVIGLNNLESLNHIYDKNIEFFYKTPIINISSHPANEDFGQINWVDINFNSSSEMIYELIVYQNYDLISSDIATNLLAGIIIKTKNFKNTDLGPDTLLRASKLISLEARREDIINNLYRFKKMPDLKLWGHILSNLKSSDDKSIIWSILESNKFNTNDYYNLQNLHEELIINLPKTKIFITFIKQLTETWFYFFPLKNLNLNILTKSLLKTKIENLEITQEKNIFKIKTTNEFYFSAIIDFCKYNLDKIIL